MRLAAIRLVLIVCTPALAAASPFAYVANGGSDTVSVIDVATDKPGCEIRVGTAPGGIAVTPEGSKVFVSTGDIASSLSVIDVAANAVAATVPGGTTPVAVAASLSRAYITNANDNTVTVIDAATNGFVMNIDVGCNPLGIALNADGSRAYVTVCGADHACATCPVPPAVGDVQVIDTTTNLVIQTIPVGIFPRGVVVSPDGTRVYVSNLCATGGLNCTPGSVSVIDAGANMVLTTVPGIPSPAAVVVNPTGTLLYVVTTPDTGPGSVSVVNTATNAVGPTIPLGNVPLGADLDPTGAKLYVANRDDNTVSVVDTAKNAVVATIPVGKLPLGLDIGPEDTGLVPRDQPGFRCANGLATSVGALAKALITCHVRAARKAVNKKPFDEEACEASAEQAYATAVGKLSGCPACLAPNGAPLRDVFASLIERANGKIFCDGTAPFAP
jgi:YVTN family beta-propeller protein